MIIVLIRWYIKSTDADIAAFLDFWKNKATIKDQSALVGEFLSQAVPAYEIPFVVDDLATEDGSAVYVNVGIWDSMEAFQQEIGNYFNDDAPPLPFEQRRRIRTVLTPQEWRIGNSGLPDRGSF